MIPRWLRDVADVLRVAREHSGEAAVSEAWQRGDVDAILACCPPEVEACERILPLLDPDNVPMREACELLAELAALREHDQFLDFARMLGAREDGLEAVYTALARRSRRP